jgi:hypothetical protein
MRVFVRTASPLLAAGVRHALPDAACEEIGERELSDPDVAARTWVLVLIPLVWQELAAWRAPLRDNFPDCPAVIIADPRIPGAFMSDLPDQCGLLDLFAPPSEVGPTCRAVAAGRVLTPAEALKRRYAAGLDRLQEGRDAKPLTAKDLECACGVSLHMSYAQIATNLQTALGSVKSELHLARLPLMCNVPH